MTAIRLAIARMRALFRRDATMDEISEELQSHVEMRTIEYVQRGLDARAARLAALRRFGNPAVIQDRGYDIRGGGVMETILQDAKYGLRQLALGVRDRLSRPGVVIVGSTFSGKGALVGVVSKELVDKGISAGDLLAAGAPALGGGGSRDPELAQAGGPEGSNLDAALDAIREEAGRALSAL